jgi:sorting nexin-41/42
LCALFPHILVPPIPEKHSIGQYASKPGKAKLNPVIVERRKLGLQAFLNRLAHHPVLSRSHVFHLFLKGEKSMADILSLLGLTKVWKMKDSSAAYSDSTKLRHPDPQWAASLDYTLKFSYFMGLFTKWMKGGRHIAQDLAAAYAEMGSVYNGWSLLEGSPALCAKLEQAGEYFDRMAELMRVVEQEGERSVGVWAFEYGWYSKHITTLLSYRHRKNVEYEVLSEKLIDKNATLRSLEASEEESIRLAAALAAQGSYAAPTPKATGFLGKLNSLLDKDPETSRRNAISKTKGECLHPIVVYH